MRLRGLSLAALAPLFGCAEPALRGMVPGTIVAQDGSRRLQLEIERGQGSGVVRAYDAVGEEAYRGRFTSVVEGLRASARTSADLERAQVTGATAALRGDKGGVLTCSMKVQPGLWPHGTGTCTDGAGKLYSLRF